MSARPTPVGELSEADRAELTRLETALWQRDTRFDRAFMERVLAADFFEYGRSGRFYTREATLAVPDQPIVIRLPLEDLRLRLLAPDVVQITYTTRVEYETGLEAGRRSSIWTRGDTGWVLRFHQGTPLPATPP